MQVNNKSQGGENVKASVLNHQPTDGSISQFKTLDNRQALNHGVASNYGNGFNATATFVEPQRPSSSKISLF